MSVLTLIVCLLVSSERPPIGPHTCSTAKDVCILQDPFAQKEEYKDSWFDKFMVNYFAKQMSKQLGGMLHASKPPSSISLIQPAW